ncbi:unnamed protein product, partial [Ixodes pacificus]
VWRRRRLRAVCARLARRSPGRATPLRVRHPAVAANPGLGGGVAPPPWSTPTPRATESVSEEKAPSLNASCAPQPVNAARLARLAQSFHHARLLRVGRHGVAPRPRECENAVPG